MISIGQKIKELMSKEKIDAPTLAEKIGKTKQAVYDMLDKQDLNTALLRTIAEVFNVPITYFFTDGEENVDSAAKIELLKKEIYELQKEVDRLKAIKLPTRDDKALDVSMKFFEAAKEMFEYYNRMKG